LQQEEQQMDNLWPSLDITPQRTPLSILKEQAALLGQQTQNLVTAEVREISPTTIEDIAKQFRFSPSIQLMPTFTYAFYLVGPALQFYRYQLFMINHSIELYPVYFRLDHELYDDIFEENSSPNSDNTVIAHTENRFIDILKAIFNAQKTIQVIQAIYAQSQSASELPAPATP
jgi:hypothetical protein